MIDKWIISGCDERIFLRPDTQRNKYHLNPMDYNGLFMRGSCTCGTLTPDGYRSALRFEDEYREDKDQDWIKRQCRRIESLFNQNHRDDFHTYFAPSGSDLMYWPLIMQSLLHPNKRISQIVSCPEELGSGSVLAAQGKYYADYNQFGSEVNNGELISPHVNPEVVFLSARDSDGFIMKRKQAIRSIIEERKGQPLICNLVFGSKSGIKDDLQIIDEFDEDVMWVVDLCQMRVYPEIIHELISKNVLLMITGSKFYQSPPFCGAMLVPKVWTERIQESSADHLKDYGFIFSASDAPPDLENLRKLWPSTPNPGLRLRWEIALDEMEAYLSIPEETTEFYIQQWSDYVTHKLSEYEFFKLMPDTQKTNNSIISFSVIRNGNELSFEELKKLFDSIVLNNHTCFEGFSRVFIGQPVRYADRSFIRLALGSYSIRHMVNAGGFSPVNDGILIDLLARTVTENSYNDVSSK
jgi:hypothetical protein